MLKRFGQGWRFLLRRSRLEDDIQREVGSHLQMEIDQRIARGVAPDEARRQAVREFGSVERVKDEIRDARGVTFWDSVVQDVRFGIRTLRRSPGYTVAAVTILALGIGANTAIFSVIDGVLLKPLPFRNGNELVLIQQSSPASGLTDAAVSIPELFDYRKRLTSIRDLVEYHTMSFVLLNQGEPDRVATAVVSANFFDMLGIRPIAGRTFIDKDDDLGAEAVLVLSNHYWREKFGADPAVVGRVLQMNNRPHTIVGVLPDYPEYPQNSDVYMPTSACPYRSGSEQALPQGGHRAFPSLNVFGRLAPGSSPQRATTEVATVAASFERDHPEDYQRAKSLVGVARSLQEELVVGARPMLFALLGTTCLVLLIACANVANLALARTSRRQRELALRTALGASRGRLFRQLVTESVIVAVAGGILGVALASLSLSLLVGFVARFTARTGQIAIDGNVLWFALGTAVLTGIVFGSAPALAARRRGLIQSVRDGSSQSGDGATRRRLRASLVVAQVAVSFVLLVGAALLLQSFYRLSNVPLGFDTRKVMTATMGPNFTKVSTPKQSLRLHQDVLERLRASPGVVSAAVTSAVPLSNLTPGQVTVQIEGHTPDPTRAYQADTNIASEGYFETLNVPVVAGRSFRVSDDAEAPQVAVINQAMAKYWDGADPVGSRFEAGLPFGQAGPPRSLTVIGVVADFHLYSPDRNVEPQYYQTFRQRGNGGGRLLVRTDGDPGALAVVMKDAVHGAEPEMPIEQIQSLEVLRHGQLAVPGLTATLLTVFAAVALLITLAGIAGVIGTTVSQRTREFGLRMALGASRASVLQLVLGQGLGMAAIGIALGLAGAWALSRVIARFLFATAPTDVVAYAAVAGLFIVATLAASLGPARRATSIDPLKSLRSE